ncbi:MULTISPECIES: MoxR family ATPase [Archaeoglobus]|nr:MULTISPECIES: MoxR family ATPase [Archaeoglobus]AIG99392.1 MoxR-like ATPase [Archaeoglobus fulgidus DSM 8774]KUJ94793.1 MAG: Methanol dehydrogenase regulatory protein (MoxR) [Archaeoglobus fulgidus]KUK06119.1 MAG: Methanol dehydrogenase regulatory protein (MoxR) [Archaeoglobus fulgidus]MDI3498377.1 MoxR-like ATPase [Archaeoglobus sp.]
MTEISTICSRIVKAVCDVYVGDKNLVEKMLAAALTNGNILFEDYPGLGKTLLAKVFARVIGADYRRVQFTPDLLPSDIIGVKIWRGDRFEFVKGPIFTNVLLADEINRSPPKTQAALLEAMEEKQITVEGETFSLSMPFFVLATQNPIEQEGTYPLPEAQMDRFMLRMRPGYPESIEEEMEILRRRISWRKDDPTEDVEPVVSLETFRRIQDAVEAVYVDKSILKYISELVRATREHELVELGSSPRGGLALLKLARALAVMDGRDFVIPDDVKRVAVEALAHRVILKFEYAVEGLRAEEVVEEILNSVRVPKYEAQES